MKLSHGAMVVQSTDIISQLLYRGVDQYCTFYWNCTRNATYIRKYYP